MLNNHMTIWPTACYSHSDNRSSYLSHVYWAEWERDLVKLQPYPWRLLYALCTNLLNLYSALSLLPNPLFTTLKSEIVSVSDMAQKLPAVLWGFWQDGVWIWYVYWEDVWGEFTTEEGEHNRSTGASLTSQLSGEICSSDIHKYLAVLFSWILAFLNLHCIEVFIAARFV